MQALGLVWSGFDPLTADLRELPTPIARPTQHGAKLLLEHWRKCEAEGGFVVGRDVPSRPLAGILRNLALYEPVGGDYRVRLAGTAFMRRFGRDISGLTFSEIYDREACAAQCAHLDEIAATKAPFIADMQLTRADRAFLRFEALRLAVLSPDRRATWILGGLFYFDWS